MTVAAANENMKLAYRAAPFVEILRGRLPDAVELEQLSRHEGPALAAMVFYKAMIASHLHGEFIRFINSRVSRPPAAEPPDRGPRPLEVVFVPSQFTFSRHEWGHGIGLLRPLAREHGFATDVIDTDPRASVTGNALRIGEYLARARPNVVLVTFGRGTSELRLLLHKRGARHPDLRKIRAWINVAGSFGGCAYSDWLRRHRLARWRHALARKARGLDASYPGETSRGFAPWRERLAIHHEMLVVSLVGVPLREHLPLDLRPSFDALRDCGPTDGRVGLADQVAHPGLAYPLWGMSHRMELEILEPVMRRLLNGLGDILLPRLSAARGSDGPSAAALGPESGERPGAVFDLFPGT